MGDRAGCISRAQDMIVVRFCERLGGCEECMCIRYYG
jgi:hypothetical protein